MFEDRKYICNPSCKAQINTVRYEFRTVRGWLAASYQMPFGPPHCTGCNEHRAKLPPDKFTNSLRSKTGISDHERFVFGVYRRKHFYYQDNLEIMF